MTKLFLCLHVLVAILAVGPVAVAASMFPPAVHRAEADPEDAGARATLRILYRICRVYAGISIAVPVLGFATAGSMGVLGDTWLIVSIGLTAAAAALLVLVVLPSQELVVDGLDATAPAGDATAPAGDATAPAGDTMTGQPALATAVPARLAMFTGVFNLLWAAVTVLMIIRPGSTTGA